MVGYNIAVKIFRRAVLLSSSNRRDAAGCLVSQRGKGGRLSPPPCHDESLFKHPANITAQPTWADGVQIYQNNIIEKWSDLFLSVFTSVPHYKSYHTSHHTSHHKTYDPFFAQCSLYIDK